MSKSTDARLAVLKVLAGQSPDYFIYPNAAAFTAEGLDPDDVAEVLDELHRDHVVTRELITVGESSDENGDQPELIGGGYRLIREEQT